MKNRFANYACPKCKLALDDEGTVLSCVKHGKFFKSREIVYFSPDEKNEFDAHWNVADGIDLPKEKLKVASEFLYSNPRGFYLGDLVLDAGCGNGVHLKILQEMNLNLNLYGIDISQESLSQAKILIPGDIKFSKADIQELPFFDETFDHAISFGVLAYVSDPSLGIKELLRVVKKNGLIGVWFYPRPEGPLASLFYFTRWVVTRLPQFLKNRMADMIVPFLYFLPTKSKMTLSNASWSQCREIVLVNISPSNLVFYNEMDLRELIVKSGGEVVSVITDQPLTIWFKKCQN